ncbi:MAG: glycosyltransferase family 4 protein [Roseiflexaceae bacterium]
MNIGIDISRLATAQKTGTERYTWELLAGMAQHPGDDSYTLYCRDIPTQLPALSSRMHIRHLPMRRLWTHVRLAAELFSHAPDTLFVPSHVVPWNAPLLRRTRIVTTIHDLGFLAFPEAHTRFQNIYLRLTTRWAARVAHRVIAISQATADDFVRYTGVDPQRVVVIPHGVASEFHPNYVSPSPYSRYMLYVGTLQPRKNIMRMIEAFAQANLHHDTHLLIGGRTGWLSQPLQQRIDELGMSQRIHLLGFVPDEQLYGLMAGARAFVFPSLYEGFGMPVLEAMASGTPVITSNTSALPEVAGVSALLVNPTDVTEIATAMHQIDTDDAVYTQLRQRGLAHATSFTWTRTAAQTLDVLRGVR